METSRNLKLTTLIILFLATFSWMCSAPAKTAKTENKTPSNAIEVKVIDYSELDGCTFLLETATGQKLQPVHLAEKYKKAGTRLSIVYKVSGDMGICMAGTMVELLFVSEIK